MSHAETAERLQALAAALETVTTSGTSIGRAFGNRRRVQDRRQARLAPVPRLRCNHRSWRPRRSPGGGRPRRCSTDARRAPEPEVTRRSLK
jgi:hypothetical protein